MVGVEIRFEVSVAVGVRYGSSIMVRVAVNFIVSFGLVLRLGLGLG